MFHHWSIGMDRYGTNILIYLMDNIVCVYIYICVCVCSSVCFFGGLSFDLFTVFIYMYLQSIKNIYRYLQWIYNGYNFAKSLVIGLMYCMYKSFCP